MIQLTEKVRIFATEIATLLTLGIIETRFILPSLNRSVAADF
jgi:hypothetical protein